MVDIIVGTNSFVTLAETNSRIDESNRAALNWLAVDANRRKRSIISAFRRFDRQTWNGSPSAVQVAATIVINGAGTGWSVDDIATVSGGTFGNQAAAVVTSVSTGAITGLRLSNTGTYTVTPGLTAVAVTGNGSSATVDLTFATQTVIWPRTGMTDCDSQAVATNIYPDDLRFAQIELAYEISQDSSLETAGGVGSNLASLKAGSVDLSFFRPTGGEGGVGSDPFPPVVMEYLECYLSGADGGRSNASFGFVSGTGGTSVVTDYPTNFGLDEGF